PLSAAGEEEVLSSPGPGFHGTGPSGRFSSLLIVESQYAVVIHGQKPFDSSSTHAPICGDAIKGVRDTGPHPAELPIRPLGASAPGHSPVRIGGLLWL